MEILFGILAICLALAVRVLFRKWKGKRADQGPVLDDIPRFHLKERADVDAAKFYVVTVDLDMGFIHAYFEGRRSPPISEFTSLEEASDSARRDSIDPLEHEKVAFVYRGREECLAIYRDGEVIGTRVGLSQSQG